MADVSSTATTTTTTATTPMEAAGKKSRGANPSVDYKALFQKSKDKYDRVSSDHTDIVANIARASAKQTKLREELDWLLDSVVSRREKARAAAEEANRQARIAARREQVAEEQYYLARQAERDAYYAQDQPRLAGAPATYGGNHPSSVGGPSLQAYRRSSTTRYRSPSPRHHYHPQPPPSTQPVRAVQDPYADHVPPPPHQIQDTFYHHPRQAYPSSRHDPYRPRSTSRSPPPKAYARSPPTLSSVIVDPNSSSKRPRPPSPDLINPDQERWAPDHKRPRND